jgi:fatty acid desaturase
MNPPHPLPETLPGQAPRSAGSEPEPQLVREEDGRQVTGAPRLPVAVVRRLVAPSPLRTWFVIGRDYAVIAATIWLCERHWSLPLYLLALLIIGGRMSSIGGLTHEAAHYNLFSSKRLNEWVALIFCSTMELFTLTPRAYRKSHLPHHAHANTRLDPDPPLQGMKRNISGARDAFWFFFDGLTLPVVYFARVFWARPLVQRLLVVATLALFIWALPTLALKLFLYWIVPLQTTYSLVLFIRLNAEHNAVDHDEPLYRTRTVRPTLLSRIFLAPAYVGYHLAHHVYPSVPWFRRHELHQLLMESSGEYRRNAHITRGYVRVVRELLSYRGQPLVRD